MRRLARVAPTNRTHTRWPKEVIRAYAPLFI